MAKCILCSKDEVNEQGYCDNHLPRGWYKYRDGMKWIKCSEQLPEFGHEVLISNALGSIFLATRIIIDNEEVWDSGFDDCCGDILIKVDITYWMPLPSLPEKE